MAFSITSCNFVCTGLTQGDLGGLDSYFSTLDATHHLTGVVTVPVQNILDFDTDNYVLTVNKPDTAAQWSGQDSFTAKSVIQFMAAQIPA